MPIYLGTFAIAFATLALQVAITRLLSITSWYHVAFFAIATGMLGMTIGAVRIYCDPDRFAEKNLFRNLLLGSLGFALCTPLTMLVLCFVPLGSSIFTTMGLLALVLMTSACLLPYYFAGIVVTLVLTRCSLPVGRVYAADLLGASLGCLFVLAAMEVLDPTSLVLVCAGLGALAGTAFMWVSQRTMALRCLGLSLILIVGGGINAQSVHLIRPLVVKGRVHPAGEYAFERANSFSHVLGSPIVTTRPQLWGASPKTPIEETKQFGMVIDGSAGTFARQFKTPADIEHLRFDVTNAAYHLRPTGGACIIGVGGGRDLQSALLFGHEDILGVDVNPIFIKLIQEDFKDFIGLADKQAVRFAYDDARGYLSHSEETFAVLQMSLIDTFAATGAGAFSLSENSLYTVEAWETFTNRLKPDGIFTVSRWYNPADLGETGRMMSLAIAALINKRIPNPAEHLALIGSGQVATLLYCARPFTPDEIESLKNYCQEYEFQSIILPGTEVQHPVLRQIMEAKSAADLTKIAESQFLWLEAPTDENPYFFNMLKFGSLFQRLEELQPGVIYGNVQASQTLAALVLVLAGATLVTVFVPLWLKPKSDSANQVHAPILWSGAIYFSFIGAGFMLVEIALIQRLSVLLSHPTYALGILLFTLILSAGVGSFLSERLPLTRAPWVYIYPLLPLVLILITSETVRYVLANYITAGLPLKVLVATIVIFPLGISLGLCFPTGMRLVRAARPGETPWYWALNGVFGVLCSALAVAISIFAWISLNFYLAAACYAIVTVAAGRIYAQVQIREQATANS